MSNKNGFNRRNIGAAWPIVLLILVLIVAVILWLGLSGSDNKPSQNSSPTPPPSQTAKIGSLVSYDLPAGWKKVDCSNALTLIVPSSQSSPSCSSNIENWPIKVTLNAHNITDCNQIKVDNQQITSHTCRSEFINGQKVINSSTTYNEKSSYGHPTKVSDYYFGKDSRVVQFEYIDNLTTDQDNYQTQFDQLVNSVKPKNA